MEYKPSSAATRETRSTGLRPFGGWALEVACRLEEQSGIRLVAPLFAASDLRRAAAFLALAAWHLPGSRHQNLFHDLTPAEFANWLLREDPTEIAEVLDRTWRDPGKLALLGGEPLSCPTDYWPPSVDRGD